MGSDAGEAVTPARRPRSPRDRVMLAFDRPDLAAARPLLGRLAPRVGAVKVGLELYTAAGPAAVEAARAAGGRVFLDLKLHDIPNTVEGAARAAARLGVDFLTVHAAGGPGLVCSPREVADVRQALGTAPLIVAPGIRGPDALPDDQWRTFSAAEALRAGSDYIVVGRPVLADSDPEGALERLVAELAAADEAAGG